MLAKNLTMSITIRYCLLSSAFLISSCVSDPPEKNESSHLAHPGNETNQDADISKETPYFGQLHSLENLTRWAIVEELLVALLETRLDLIEEEASLITGFLSDYEESSGKAIEHAHASNMSLEQRGRLIGSSFVLGHRMTSRFCGVTKKLREFLKSSEYVQIEEGVKNVLNLKPVPAIPQNQDDDSTESLSHVSEVEALSHNGSTTDYQSAPEVESTAHYNHLANENETENGPAILQLEEMMFLKLRSSGNESKSNIIAVPRDWPDWPDMYMSMTSFITLQEVNGIPPEKAINGLTIDTAAGGHLNAFHCVEIGMFALRRGRYYMAVDWLEVALEVAKAEYDIGNETISPNIVHSLFRLAVQQHNRVWQELNLPWNSNHSNQEMFVNPLTESMFSDKTHVSNFRQATFFHYRGIEEPNPWEPAQHIDVCIGHNRQTPKMQINLNCFYEKKRHPYLYINPIKVEMLSEKPPVFQFYDMLGNETMEHIKFLARNRLRLSSLVGIATDDWDAITTHRTSVGAGMDYMEIPKAYKLAGMVSGLKIIDASEFTQVVEYVYGRHYIHHPDTYDDEKDTVSHVRKFGDRLEIPEMGGLTSFCSAGIGGHHVRGSAVFWFNMYRNGTSRKDVQHGACPVIHGHKIVANHWITYFDNWKHYQCSLSQFE